MEESISRGWARWALVVPVVVWSSPFLFSSDALWGVDYAMYFRPHFQLARDSLRRDGEFPLWNPLQYSGTPYLGNLQTNFAYPPNWLFLALPTDDAYKWLVFAHVLLAVWGSYRLARELGISRAGAVIAALAFGLSVSTTGRVAAGHYPNFVSQCQAPGFVWLLLRLLRRPDTAAAVTAGGWLAVMIASGTPQWVLHLALLSAGILFWKRREIGRRVVTAGAAAVGLAVGLSAVAWIPDLEVASNSTRGQAWLFYEYPLILDPQSFLWKDWLHFVTPWYPTDTTAIAKMWQWEWWHEKAVYIGILPIMLAVTAIASRRRGPILFFGIVALAAMLEASSGYVPLHFVLSFLPLYGKFRVPARAAWVAVLSLSLLAGFGWDLLRVEKPRKKLLRGIALGVAAFAAVSAAWFEAPIEAAWALALLAGSVLVIARFGPKAAMALAAADLCFFAIVIHKVVPRESLEEPPWYAAHIPAEMRGEFRLLDVDSVDSRSIGQGFRLLNGYGHPIPARLPDFYGRAWEDYDGVKPESLSAGSILEDPSILDRLSVGWIVSKHRLEIGPPWRTLLHPPHGIIYENPAADPLPRRVSVNRIEFDCRAQKAASVTVGETWAPGWRATVNGKRAPVLDACDGTLIRVEVPAGDSKVELVYDPIGRWVGLWITIFSFAAAAIIAFGIRRSRRATPA